MPISRLLHKGQNYTGNLVRGGSSLAEAVSVGPPDASANAQRLHFLSP